MQLVGTHSLKGTVHTTVQPCSLAVGIHKYGIIVICLISKVGCSKYWETFTVTVSSNRSWGRKGGLIGPKNKRNKTDFDALVLFGFPTEL